MSDGFQINISSDLPDPAVTGRAVADTLRALSSHGLTPETIAGLSREEIALLLRERVAATPEFKRWSRWYLPFGGASRWEHLRAVFRKPR